MTITDHRAKVAGRMPCKCIARLLTFEEKRRNEEFFACQVEAAERWAAQTREILASMQLGEETEAPETIQ